MSSQQVKRVTVPLSEQAACALRAGDVAHLTGTLYTARDAAHERLMALIEAGEELPIELEGQVIYYCGPTPAPPGRPIGSAGPTTSYRMDDFTPELYRLGLRGTIGKGNRSAHVRTALKRHGGVYFVAVGGAGALLSDRIVSAQVVAWPELGPEAIRRLDVEDFPVIVGYDCQGGTAFVSEKPLG
ncbi:MAG: FumA C-terminus/TtdB family hydratase beta subunit [Armatimonadota bacterium]|nr:FumA C-terminus/TtdB family hydratase beta subunit [Armatimonadota bacterium]